MKKGIISVVSGIIGAATGVGVVGNRMNKKLSVQTQFSEKHLALYMLMTQWVQVKQEGKSLVSYFEANGYKNIAVYGMNYVGQTLCLELEGSSVKIQYGIDQNAANIYSDCKLVTMDESLEEVDAVVVTPIYFFDEIAVKLEEKLDCPIISIEDILYEV